MIEIIDDTYLIDTDLAEFRQHEEKINIVMEQAAGGHQNEHDHFTPLSHNPEEHPFQRADCVAMLGKAATVDTFQGLAPFIFPAFDEVVENTVDSRQDLLNHSGDVLGRSDLHVLTDHRDVVGVAVAGAIIASALYTSRKVPHGSIDSSIAVSTMLKNTEIIGLPAASLLRDIFSITKFVVPSSNPRNKQQLPNGYATAFNQSSQAIKVPSANNSLHAVAPSGTRDIRVHRSLRPGHPKPGYYIGPPSNGTIETYMTDTYCIDMGVDLSKGANGIYLGEMWTPRHGSVAGLAIMESIAQGITKVSGIKSHFIPEREKFNELKKRLHEEN